MKSVDFFLVWLMNIFNFIKNCQKLINCLLMKNLQTGFAQIAKKSFFLIVSLSLSFTLLAQKTVTGKVSDNNGNPLSGVSVVVKGGTKGTSTNVSGEYSLTANIGETLNFSMVGFQEIAIKVGQGNDISVQLQPKIGSIDEVVVIGYGTQKRTSVTGAISSVGAKTLTELPVVSVPEALQGRVPGLQVTNNGSPGTEPIVTIRGISSISYASNPLYVIDGFPTGDLSTFDTRDVESVDVLKDASASAIYGSRATNGVIIITTKKGRRDGKIHVSLSTNYGIQEVTKRLSLLNPAQFDQYAIAYRGSLVPRRDPNYESAPGVKPNYPGQPIYQGASTTYGNNVTNWQDAYFKQGAMNQTNIALSGGNDLSRFNASVGYFNQTGIAPSVGYKRYNARINSEHKISKVFNFGENLYMASGNQTYDNNETGSRTNLLNVIRIMPYMPVHDPTTSDGYRGVNSVLDGGDPTNPIENAKVNNPGTRSTVKVFGTAYLEVNFTRWLKFRTTAGIDYANGLDYRFSPIFNDSGTVAGSNSILATITNNRAVSTVQLYTQQLSFDKTFGDHHIGAVAVYEYQGQTVRNENASGNQASNDLQTLNNASNISYQSLIGKNALISYLGRVNYDFKGKYLLSGAIRRDGLSVWAPGKKWATFPSGSVGWRVDQENFMKGVTKVSELKLRGGYGITGLNGTILGNTPWLVGVNANSAYYPFGNSLNSGPLLQFKALETKN